ncbi:HD domain-containing phosphohydrolase [Candidatus Hydrogenedentota bacterium]
MASRILFVDDDQIFLDVLKRMLEKQESIWEMVFVTSVNAALKAVEEQTFDAVISDAQMPMRDGFSLLKELRSSEVTKDIPVVILTGAGDPALKRRALDLGATDLLDKPVLPEDLRARIRNALRLKSYQDALRRQNEILEMRVEQRTAELEMSRREILWHLAKAGEYRDDDTGNHVVRVGWTSRAISEALGLEREFSENIFLAGPLHDIGKIGISDNVLLKKARLTAAERSIIERHCLMGADILSEKTKGAFASLTMGAMPPLLKEDKKANPLLHMAATIAHRHHERWKSGGYPAGLSGEGIPLEARIVAVSDVYDALTSQRPYKPAYSEGKAMNIIRDENGEHFDPEVFGAFESVLDDVHEFRAQLADGTLDRESTPDEQSIAR